MRLFLNPPCLKVLRFTTLEPAHPLQPSTPIPLQHLLPRRTLLARQRPPPPTNILLINPLLGVVALLPTHTTPQPVPPTTPHRPTHQIRRTQPTTLSVELLRAKAQANRLVTITNSNRKNSLLNLTTHLSSKQSRIKHTQGLVRRAQTWVDQAAQDISRIRDRLQDSIRRAQARDRERRRRRCRIQLVGTVIRARRLETRSIRRSRRNQGVEMRRVITGEFGEVMR